MITETNCIHALVSLQVDPSGQTRICCMSSQNLATAGKTINIATDDLQLAWNSDTRKEIRDSLQRGQKHKNCDLCWTEESAGRESKRIRDNRTFKSFEVYESQPTLLDLKMGHLCNLKCRTCGSHSSSRWVKEEYDIEQSPRKDTFEKFSLKYQSYKNAFADESKNWEILKSWSPRVRHFDFFGGEPMLIENHWKLLKEIVASGASNSQTLHYNTNGTIFPEEYFNLYNSFQGLEIAISVDGVEAQLEYIRHPAKWEQVKRNITLWKEKINHLEIPQKNLSLCLTVSLYNIFDLDTIYNSLKEYGLYIFINIVHWPDSLCIQNLPDEVKETISEKLKTGFGDSWTESGAEAVILFMNQKKSDPLLWKEFLNKIKTHDQYRGESFPTTFPAYYQLIQEGTQSGY